MRYENETYQHPYTAVVKGQGLRTTMGQPVEPGTAITVFGRFTDHEGEWYKAETAAGDQLVIRLQDFN